MKCFAFALLLLSAGVNADASTGHPIEKVINLLEGLKDKAITQGKQEQVDYEKFQYWCSTSSSELKDAIADEKERIAELEDKLAGLNKDKESLESEISTLEGEIADMEAAAKKAKEDRRDEAALYDKADTDLASTIKAVNGCIAALEGAESSTESMMLAQHHVKMVLALVSVKATNQQRRVLAAFGRPDQLAAGDEAAHVDKYDFKSENVIELLKNLLMKFEDDKLAGTKDETNALNSYALAKEARDNSIDAATKSKRNKEKELGATNKSIAESNKELKNTQADLKADSTTLSDTEDACRTKQSEWEKRSGTRSLEIEAMDQAMKILAKSTGVRTEAPGNPVPPPSPVFFQVRSVSDPKMKAVALLREAAKDTNSRALERLAVEVAAHLNGPFDAVNNMIEKMIFRLMDEQKQEDEHKHWCDQEIKKTNVMKTDKNDKILNLAADIELEQATVQNLGEEIADAEKMISDINTFVKEATEIRNTGKKENAAAVKDSKDAQNSLTNAIAVLEAFYKESGQIKKEPWEFIQAPVGLSKNPSTWDSGYSAVSDPTNKESGIISILESVLSDFEKMEAETKSQDAQDKAAFDQDMKDNDIEKAGRTQEAKMKSADKARRVDNIASLSSTRKNVEGELEKTEQYLEDLKPACVNGDSSYDARKAARSKEIKALKTAQQTLLDAFKENNKGFLQIHKH